MNARWNKPIESLKKATGENLTSIEAQSNREALVTWKNKGPTIQF